MTAVIRELCTVFADGQRPPRLHGIATCPESGKVFIFSSDPEDHVAWVQSRLRSLKAASQLIWIKCSVFRAEGEQVDRSTAALAAERKQCEREQAVCLFPGSVIFQLEQGTLGSLLFLENGIHLISAEHILARTAMEPIFLCDYGDPFMVARSTKLNGGLMASNTPAGDFELGKICDTSAIKPMPTMPESCGAIRPTGEWICEAGLSAICGLPVHACVNQNERKAAVLGVSACVEVHFGVLPGSGRAACKRFSDHIILKAESGNSWHDGDSGAMVFAAESRGGVNKGDALGIMFAISDNYLCVTPFERIVSTLQGMGQSFVRLMR